ncbi:hypothetical protein DFH27DRAFT_578682 [Peziza echinospora]|nr:hypothetical protein DFH27DRAFT_578682 [Peziza echinospora]
MTQHRLLTTFPLLLALLLLIHLPAPARAAECFPELRTGIYNAYVDAGIWAVRVRLCNAGVTECPDTPDSYCELSGDADANGVFAKGWRRGGYSTGTAFPFCLNATRDIIEGCWKAPLKRMGGAWTDGPERYEIALFHVNDTARISTTAAYVADSYKPTTFISASSKPVTSTKATGTSSTSPTTTPAASSSDTSTGGGAKNTDAAGQPINVTNNNGMSAGTTAGIAVGVTLGVLFILGIVFLLYRASRKRKARAEAAQFITYSDAAASPGAAAPLAPYGAAGAHGATGYFDDATSTAKTAGAEGWAGAGAVKDPVEVSSIRPAGELAVNEFAGGELYGSPALVEMEGDSGVPASKPEATAAAAAAGPRRKDVPGERGFTASPPPMYMHEGPVSSSTPAVPGGSVGRYPAEGEEGHWNRV